MPDAPYVQGHVLTARFSPEDQAVLEAEYQKNPKPDKAARMDIVRRVALGEKEVQVGSTKSWPYRHSLS